MLDAIQETSSAGIVHLHHWRLYVVYCNRQYVNLSHYDAGLPLWRLYNHMYFIAILHKNLF